MFKFGLVSKETKPYGFNDMEAWDMVSKIILRPDTNTLTLASFYGL